MGNVTYASDAAEQEGLLSVSHDKDGRDGIDADEGTSTGCAAIEICDATSVTSRGSSAVAVAAAATTLARRLRHGPARSSISSSDNNVTDALSLSERKRKMADGRPVGRLRRKYADRLELTCTDAPAPVSARCV
jgi:hypothetical protein